MSHAFPRVLATELCRGPPKDFEIKFVLNNGRNKFSFSCSRGLRHFSTPDGLWSKFKFNSLEWRNIVAHGQLKENLYIS